MVEDIEGLAQQLKGDAVSEMRALGEAYVEIGDGRVAEGIAADLGNEIVPSVPVEACAETADAWARAGSAENDTGIVDGDAGGAGLQVLLIRAGGCGDGAGGAHGVRQAGSPLA